VQLVLGGRILRRSLNDRSRNMLAGSDSLLYVADIYGKGD